ncbi:translocation/assembly module TamB domain-containing protein [Streptomyces erythrochromogenes]|uniref:hypothetical protein n=1 Tax=Streptomyces erythrochromogenes TaxID=285574 RepID=UPI0036C9EF8A
MTAMEMPTNALGPHLSGRDAGWNQTGSLRAPEQELLDCAAAEQTLDLAHGSAVDRQAMSTWGPEQTIRAEVLRRLLVEQQWPVHPKGVGLRGTRITGRLDLESTTLRCQLVCEDCFFDSPEPLILDYATATRIALIRCDLAGLTGNTLSATRGVNLTNTVMAGSVRLPGAQITGGLSLFGAVLSADSTGAALSADGAKVNGGLFLDALTARGTVRLMRTDVTGQLSLRGAKLISADSTGTALYADGAKAGGGLFLDGDFIARGAVRLTRAEVQGQLSLRGAKLTGADNNGNALNADGAKVNGGLFLDEVTAHGTMRLMGSEITGQLSLCGAKLISADSTGTALYADEAKVVASAVLDKVTAHGTVRLMGSEITGQLSLRGTKLNSADPTGTALYADRMKVNGNVFLDEGFTSAGAVRLTGTVIAGQLSLRGAKLTGADNNGDTLDAHGTTVGDGMFLDGDFTSVGAVQLSGATIDGTLTLDGAKLGTQVALMASDMQVSHQLRWRPREIVLGMVNLERASVRHLVDDWSLPAAHWPQPGQLLLAGFKYEEFGGLHQATCKQRLEWIRSSHAPAYAGTPAIFASQPYGQLALVYRRTGQEKEAREVSIARRSDLRKYGDLGLLGKSGNRVFGLIFAHGYKPLRAVWWLVGVYILVFFAYLLAQQHDIVVPAKPTSALKEVPTAQDCVEDYPCFYPAGYAVDVVIPLINVRQAENWRINGDAPWGWAWTAGTGLATGLGWGLSTLAVAGYTGLIRRD